MLKVYAAANLQDAYLIAGLLAELGIAARITNENAQGALGEIPFTQAYPEVWIDDPADAPRARALIAEIERREPTSGTLDCPACGEENPENFQLCWRCGAALTPRARTPG